MKINTPITQVERTFPKGQYLVSKTDLKGITTYANDAFVELSGFSRVELIGKNHNIVRHPDMPPQAFAWLWDTLHKGRPWRGVVKNRAKNGDHYWVEAFVTPIVEGSKTVGYISVRCEPRRDQVKAAADLYARLNASGAKIKAGGSWLKNLTIRAKLLATMSFVLVLLIAGAVVGIGGVELSNQALNSTYTNRLEPVDMLWKITNLMNENRAQVMRALQHDAANEFHKMHDHPLTVHTDAIARNRDEITALWKEYGKRERSSASASLSISYAAARAAYVTEGLVPARKALLDGDYRKANEILLTKVLPLYDEAFKQVILLLDQTKLDAKKDYETAVWRYELIRNYGLAGTLLSVLLIIASCGFLIRSISRPMEQAMRHSDKISQGDLTDEIDITGRDEAGAVLASMASMQANLKAMLDEVMHASHIIDQRGADLQAEMNEVSTMSQMQHEQVEGVASATEEFSQSVKEVSERAEEASNAASNSQTVITHTHDHIEQSMRANAEVVSSVRASGDSIVALDLSIQKIGDITKTIRGIADQTNLLALNAAIEAARAGESGRGFAVVADEVRKLADRTSTATSDIASMVDEVRRVTDTTVESMGNAVKAVESGVARMQESVSGLDQIAASSQTVTEMSHHIALAAKEQAAAGEDVASSMCQITALIEVNTESVRNAKGSTDALRQTAEGLRNMVSRFKIVRDI